MSPVQFMIAGGVLGLAGVFIGYIITIGSVSAASKFKDGGK